MLALAVPHSGDAQQSSVGVTVNGQQVNLSPAPIERAGRVFVPLRGVFERLGASVVYANGQINATGNGRNISLNIGSNQATVNGQQQLLDVAPFIVGASTYVPLRFVAQALGDAVNWDNSNSIVAITTNGAVSQAPPPQQRPEQRPDQQRPEPPARSPIGVAAEQPSPDGTVASNRPTIEARFQNGQADPNSIRIMLDDLDVTNNASRSPNGVVFSPPSDLMAQRHRVVVRGKDAEGRPFDFAWQFTSGSRPEQTYLDVTTPQNNATVGSTFTVRGRTMPNSHVTIEAGGSANVGGFLVMGTGTYRGDVEADANGNFTQDVSLSTVPGGTINLVVSATDPATKAAAPQVRRRLIRG
jgi:hypothetical protein